VINFDFLINVFNSLNMTVSMSMSLKSVFVFCSECVQLCHYVLNYLNILNFPDKKEVFLCELNRASGLPGTKGLAG
jgi:hypothetical protein